jgi:hypothetical protein
MRKHLLLLVAGAALAASGCDKFTDPLGAVVGTWSLTAVSGAALPGTLSDNGTTKREVLNMTLTISGPGGTYTTVSAIRTTTNGIPTNADETDNGTFFYENSILELRSTNQSLSTYTVNGNSMSGTDAKSGKIFVFTRQ